MSNPAISLAEGSGSHYYENMNAVDYANKINTPAQNSVYFERFHKPLVEAAKLRRDSGVPRLLDVACGPAYELDFLKDDLDVELFATDMSPKILEDVKARLGDRAHLFAAG